MISMTQANFPESFDNSGDAYDPAFDALAKLYLFIGFGFLCLVEWNVIHGLWFTHRSSDTFDMFSLPLIVLLPSVMALAAILAVRKLSRKGQIQPTAAGRVAQIIGGLVFIAYLVMLRLAEIAFR
jgi:hypothetical protein